MNPVPLCQYEILDRTTKQRRYCTWPVLLGEAFCARHGGKRKTMRVPLYKRWITASVKRLAKVVGRRISF